KSGDYNWKLHCQLAFLQWMAGAEDAYTATCQKLVAQHRSSSDSLESTAIAMVCLLDPKIAIDREALLSIARKATSTGDFQFGADALVGAVLHRAGKQKEAPISLNRLQSAQHAADLTISPVDCSELAIGMMGDAVLLNAHLEMLNKDEYRRHAERLRAVIDRL